MRVLRFFALAVPFPGISSSQAAQPPAPQTLTIPCDNLHLKALFWKPTGNGPGSEQRSVSRLGIVSIHFTRQTSSLWALAGNHPRKTCRRNDVRYSSNRWVTITQLHEARRRNKTRAV
jgi:hypothetical protein